MSNCKIINILKITKFNKKSIKPKSFFSLYEELGHEIWDERNFAGWDSDIVSFDLSFLWEFNWLRHHILIIRNVIKQMSNAVQTSMLLDIRWNISPGAQLRIGVHQHPILYL